MSDALEKYYKNNIPLARAFFAHSALRQIPLQFLASLWFKSLVKVKTFSQRYSIPAKFRPGAASVQCKSRIEFVNNMSKLDLAHLKQKNRNF